jgi:hypothetical protein
MPSEYFPELGRQGLRKPFLTMNHTINDHGFDDFAPYSQPLFDLATTKVTWLKIVKSGHFTFSDFAWAVEMTSSSRQGSGAINACLVWFFDTYLKGEAPPFPTNSEIYNVQRK